MNTTPGRKGLISYDGLPISSGGAHGLGRLKPAQAWQALQRFLAACTTASEPNRVSLTINQTPDVEPAALESLIASAQSTLKLQTGQRQECGELGVSYDWDLPDAQAGAAVEWLAAAKPVHNRLGGTARVSLNYRFCLKSADGSELPFQTNKDYLGQKYDGYGTGLGESGCRLTLSARSALSILMFLPFEEPGAELWNYVGFLEEHLPMKLSNSHWKHWKLTKKGDNYISRRVSPQALL